MSVLPRAPTPTSIGHAIARTAKYYGAGLAKALFTLPIFIWAQAVAFKVFITLLPLILLATGVFGLVLRQDKSSEIVTDFLRDFLPAGQSEPLVELVQQLQSASGGLTFVGAAAFLVTVITLLSTLRYVIGMAMGGDRHQMRSILKGYAFDMRMMLQVGSLFLVSFGLTLGTRLLKEYGTEWGISTSLVDQFGVMLTTAIPYAITLGMIVQLYYFIPRPHPPKRSAMWGAAVAALLFEGAKNGFAFYATHIGKFDRYSASAPPADAPGLAEAAASTAEAAAASVADAAAATPPDGLGDLGGVFGLILAFVFWVYLSGLILVVGAVVTTLHEKRHRPRRHALRRVWKQFGIRRRSSHPEAGPAANAPTGESAMAGSGIPRSPETPEASGGGTSGDGSPGEATPETASGDGAAPEAAPGLPSPAPLPRAPEASGDQEEATETTPAKG